MNGESINKLPQDIQAWIGEMTAALHVIEAFEQDELEEFEKMQDLKTKKLVSEMSYFESFDYRLLLLAKFANKKVKDRPEVNKVEHVFSTILNGIRSAIEVNAEFKEDPEKFNQMSEVLRNKFEKNRLDVDSGKKLVIRAIKYIKTLGWGDSLRQMYFIWNKASERDPASSDGKVAWSGGGQELARTLGSTEDPWNPFDLFDVKFDRE